jgi:outer membrane protein
MIWSASVQTQWAIWEWGSNYYRMKQSQVRKSMAESQLSSVVDRVRLGVRQAYLSVQEWKEALEVAKASIEQAEENFRITEERFKANVTTSTEVLDAQTMLAQARVNYYSALSNLNVAQAKLEQNMGTLKANKAERK